MNQDTVEALLPFSSGVTEHQYPPVLQQAILPSFNESWVHIRILAWHVPTRRRASTGCYVDVKSLTHESSYFLMTFLPPDQRETGCYAWHGVKAVALTWDASLSQAL